MIIRYKYGIVFRGKIYGWKNKDLYRLPQMIGNRFYSLKKCPKWVRNGKDMGYGLGAAQKSHAQLKAMTHFINREVEEIVDNDCLF